ncbi:MAG: SufE family protein [Chitinophagaceae bacterium]
MNTIRDTEKEIVEEFALFDNNDDKYEYIIDLGKKLPPLDEKYKTDENKVRGCQSSVWLQADYKEGKIFFSADSDSVLVKGLISMLVRVLSGRTPDEIIATPLDFIREVGLTSFLAQTRSNGLLSMVKQIKSYALGFKLKHSTT